MSRERRVSLLLLPLSHPSSLVFPSPLWQILLMREAVAESGAIVEERARADYFIAVDIPDDRFQKAGHHVTSLCFRKGKSGKRPES